MKTLPIFAIILLSFLFVGCTVQPAVVYTDTFGYTTVYTSGYNIVPPPPPVVFTDTPIYYRYDNYGRPVFFRPVKQRPLYIIPPPSAPQSTNP